jgi:hypothetical protein
MEPPGAEQGNWESPGGMIRGSPRLLSIAPWADFSSRRAPLAEITWNKQRRFEIKFPIAEQRLEQSCAYADGPTRPWRSGGRGQDLRRLGRADAR